MSCIEALICKTVFINLGQDNSHQLSVPSSEQSLAPKNTVTAAILVSAAFGQLIRRGRIILAHLELYPDSPLFTTSHFLRINLKFRILTVSKNTHERTSISPCFSNTGEPESASVSYELNKRVPCYLASLSAISAPQPFAWNEYWRTRRQSYRFRSQHANS